MAMPRGPVAAGPRRYDGLALRIEGLTEFRRELKKIQPEFDKQFTRRLRTIARQVRDDARGRAPLESGALRRSVKHSVTRSRMTLYSSLPYAPVHEWGTREPIGPRTQIKPQGVPISIPRSQMIGGAIYSKRAFIEGQIVRIFEDAARGHGFDD